MANNTLKARLIQASKTEAEWKSSNPVLLKGEVAYSSDKKQRKTGDGSSKWTDITYDKSVPTEHTHNYAGSSSAGGVANSANKLATPRKINGIAFDGTKDINNVIYTTKKDYDTLVKTGTYDKSAMYVTTDEIDDMSKFNTDLLDSSTSLAKQGKYLSYSDQNGGKYLSIKNTTDNSTVGHAKLMDGESGEGMDIDADKVKTIDSKGILIDALGETTAQALIDEVAKRVIDLTGRMSTTETGLQSANDAITSLNSNIEIQRDMTATNGLRSIIQSSALNELYAGQLTQSFVFQMVSINATNAPVTSEGLCLSIKNKDGGYGSQIFISDSSFYYRRCKKNIFEDWIKIV